MRRRALLGMLGTAGVAGCLRLDESSETDTQKDEITATESATEATTTTAQTTTADDSTTDRPAEASYPLGVSDDGVQEFLFSAHTRALTGTSFRTSWQKINHTQSLIGVQKSYDVESGVAVGEWTRRDGGLVSMYRERGRGLWREDLGGDFVYGEDEAGFDWYKVAWQPEVQSQLSAWDWGTPERVNETRPAEWEVKTSEIADESVAPGYHEATVLSLDGASMRFDEDGVIRELTSTYTVEENGDYGETLTYETQYETHAFGDVSVSEPSWAETAAQQSPKVRTSYANDRRFVAVTIETGGRIAADSRIVVVPESGPADRYLVELREPLEPGATAYVWQDESAETYRNARLSRGSPPSDVTPVRFEGNHNVIAYRDTTAYFPEVSVE